MFAKTGLALVVPAAAIAALVAGCGSSAKVSAGSSDSTAAAATTSTPATVTDTVVPPATTTTATAGSTPTASGPTACATADLTVSLGSPEGTAGSEVYPLHFTNKGSAGCTITAFPGVSFVAPGNGKQVGAPATRSTGTTAATVTLSPGAEATAELQITDYQNYPASSCAATAVSGLRVYPPNNTAADYVTLPSGSKACTKAAQLQVQPVTAGAGSS